MISAICPYSTLIAPELMVIAPEEWTIIAPKSITIAPIPKLWIPNPTTRLSTKKTAYNFYYLTHPIVEIRRCICWLNNNVSKNKHPQKASKVLGLPITENTLAM